MTPWDTPLPPGADPSTPVCQECGKRRASCFEMRKGASPDKPQFCSPCYLARWHIEMAQTEKDLRDQAAKDAEP